MNRTLRNFFAVVATAFSVVSCKKETETVIEYRDKEYSWPEVQSLFGEQRIIVSTGSDGTALYFQQPNSFTRFTGQSFRSLQMSGGRLPTDLAIRLPIGRDFFAYPANDSLLVVCRNNDPLYYEAFVQLRRLDRTATRLETRAFALSKCMAISRNNFLLVPYATNRPDRPFTFLLLAVTPGAPSTRVSVSPQLVTIPIPAGQNTVSTYLRSLAAVEDYFLVSLGEAGVYKIRQDGSFRKVYSSALVNVFYKWQNVVYAPVEPNQLLTSADDGETWSRHSGTPRAFTAATYHTIRDSLIGVHNDQLFTLRWNGPRFTIRALKNDGLERRTITGVEYLRDTVYVATTSGLLARPVRQFFETKD